MDLGRVEGQPAPEHEPVDGGRAGHVEGGLPAELLGDGLQQGTGGDRTDGGRQIRLRVKKGI